MYSNYNKLTSKKKLRMSQQNIVIVVSNSILQQLFQLLNMKDKIWKTHLFNNLCCENE